MEIIIEMLYSMTLSAIMVLLPILCTLSFVYSWNSFIQAVLIAAILTEYLMLTSVLYLVN